jgi:two-component system OmpR family sensor kinase
MRSIRRHLLHWLIGALSLGAIAFALTLYAVALEEMNEVFDEQLKQVALTVLTHYDRKGARIPPHKSDLEEVAFVTQVWSLDGVRLFTSVPNAGIPLARDEGFKTVAARDGAWRVYTDRSTNYLTQAAQPMEARYELAADLALKMLVPGLLAVPLLGWLLGYALRRGLQPLSDTSHEVERRSAASLEPIATQALPRELQPLVASLNSLMAKLKTALAAQRQFTADAAHELRTPLTALRLQVQLLLLAQDDRTRHEAALDIRHGLDRATHLVEQLLNLSRVEPDALPAPHETVDLVELVKAAVAQFSIQADARRIDLGADIAVTPPNACEVVGDTDQLRVMLNNLIDNALRYTPRGGTVDVRLHAGGDASSVLLEVVDSGPGIAAKERERVFDRFYRVRGSQGTDGGDGGTGLGLAIVKAVADKHGARVELADGSSTGLIVRVTLRLAPG